MANGFVILPLDTSNTGKQVQNFVNTVSAQTVYAQAVAIVTSGGVSCDPPSGTGVAVLGNAASGSSDSGPPVKVGGVYNTALPTLTNGQRGDIQLDASARQLVVASGDTAAAATDGGNPIKVGGVFNKFATLPAYTDAQRGNLQIDPAGTLKVGFVSLGALLEVGSTNAAAANNQTLAGAANKMTYITGFSITGNGATGQSTIAVTVTGITNTLTYYINVPAGATLAITPLMVRFDPPIPSTAVNTAIVVSVPSFGTGNLQCSANAHGFQL
jgi:hypothetical protein